MKTDYFVVPKSLRIDNKTYKIKLLKNLFLGNSSCGGIFDPLKKEIRIKTSKTERSPAEILFHELSHLYAFEFDPSNDTEAKAQILSKFWLNIFNQLMRHDPVPKIKKLKQEVKKKNGKRK